MSISMRMVRDPGSIAFAVRATLPSMCKPGWLLLVMTAAVPFFSFAAALCGAWTKIRIGLFCDSS